MFKLLCSLKSYLASVNLLYLTCKDLFFYFKWIKKKVKFFYNPLNRLALNIYLLFTLNEKVITSVTMHHQFQFLAFSRGCFLVIHMFLSFDVQWFLTTFSFYILFHFLYFVHTRLWWEICLSQLWHIYLPSPL